MINLAAYSRQKYQPPYKFEVQRSKDRPIELTLAIVDCKLTYDFSNNIFTINNLV